MASNEGVVSIDMDIEAGLVKISGGNNLDPSIFVKTIAKAGKKAQFPAMGNAATAPAPAATIDIVSDHHNRPSINSDNRCHKIDRTKYGNSDSSHFSDHHGCSDKVHINEAAAVNPPVALPLHNQQFMRPVSQYGGVGFRGSHGSWPRISESMSPPPPMPPMPPAHGYYRWSEPLPYYLQEQPPPVGNAPGHYLFNDENTDGLGKEAKLWFFQKETDCKDEATDHSKSGSKIEHGGIECDGNNEDDRQFDWHSQHECVTETMGMKEQDWEFWHLPAMSSDMSSDVQSRSLPRLGSRPVWPYHQSVPGHTLTTHGYYLEPHPPPTYRYFQRRSPRQDNPMMQPYTDYADNYRL
ncbi:unnamed protein product [Citrullus colocynthis]|uniref:Uncharacterized protein n=1 Tax=Citrullus colocynthis TaxID=252529 RepID=A0ABP0XTY1_9ROSI